MTNTHPVYPKVLTGGDRWTHPPADNTPTLTAYPGPVTAAGKQLLMSALQYPDGTLERREIAQVGDRPPEARALAFRLNPLLGASYEQSFHRLAQLQEGDQMAPFDRHIVLQIGLYRQVIAAALYDLGQPVPTALHIIANPSELDAYLTDLDTIKIRINHLQYEVEIGATGEKTLLHGPTGEGKSWFALWLATKLAQQGQRTAFILTEGGKYAAARVKKTWQKHGLNDELHPLLIVPFGQTHLDPERIGTLQKTLEKHEINNLVLDVLSPLLTDENSAGEYNTIRKILAPLTSERFYLEVHHHNKAQGAPRGTGRILDDAAYDLKVTKSKSGNPLLTPGNKIQRHHENRLGRSPRHRRRLSPGTGPGTAGQRITTPNAGLFQPQKTGPP